MAGILGKALKGAAEVAKPMAMQKMRDNATKSRDARLNEMAKTRTAEGRTYQESQTEKTQEFKSSEAAKDRESRENIEASRTSRGAGGGGGMTAKQKDAKSLVAAGVYETEKEALKFVHSRGTITAQDILKVLNKREADSLGGEQTDIVDLAAKAKQISVDINKPKEEPKPDKPGRRSQSAPGSKRSAPPVGTERGGHRFIGGDPGKKENWERI